MKYFKFSLRRKSKHAVFPKEVWMCVYPYLDSTKAFGETCRLFKSITQDTTCKASWIVTHYGRRLSIYYSLLILPHHCNPEFLYTLFRLGARLPTCLTQALVQNYGKKPSDHFSTQIQHIPFEGYVYLMGKSQSINILGDENKDFFTSLIQNDGRWKIQLDSDFFPLSITRTILKLAQIDPVRFQCILPLFEFDIEARISLWQAVLSLFLDEAFRKSPMTEERKTQLQSAHFVIQQSGTADTFCRVFSEFFTKYPRGYCDPQTMNRMVDLLLTFIKPIGFSMPKALKSIKNLRDDIQEALDASLGSL